MLSNNSSKHSAEFVDAKGNPQFVNAKQYVEAAHAFVTPPCYGTDKDQDTW